MQQDIQVLYTMSDPTQSIVKLTKLHSELVSQNLIPSTPSIQLNIHALNLIILACISFSFKSSSVCMTTTICTMMKPYFKGETASAKPMYSRNLIHPDPSYIIKNSACGWGNIPQCLGCGIIVQISCTMVVWVVPWCGIMEFLGLHPRNSIIPHSGYNTHTP